VVVRHAGLAVAGRGCPCGDLVGRTEGLRGREVGVLDRGDLCCRGRPSLCRPFDLYRKGDREILMALGVCLFGLCCRPFPLVVEVDLPLLQRSRLLSYPSAPPG
jgi:hypothetical protein